MVGVIHKEMCKDVQRGMSKDRETVWVVKILDLVCCVESLKASYGKDLEKELGPRLRTFLGRIMDFKLLSDG